MPPRSQDEWSDLVDRFELSSLSQPAFARKHSLPLSTFRYHLYRLRRLRASCTDLVPCPPPPVAEDSPEPLSFLTLSLPRAPEDASPALAVDLGPRLRLRFERLPQPQQLAEIVAALVERLPC